MQFFRKIVFYICTAIYIVACPMLILYAVGYFYEPGVTGGIVKTGLISLATAPSGATVYVNKEEQTPPRTPTLIRELLPGDYNVALQLAGYDKWQKTVHVIEEKASVFDKVILMPSKREKKEISHGSYQDLIELPGTDIVLLDGGKGLGSINVYNISNGKEWPLARAKSPFEKYTPNSFITRENDDSFILLASSAGETKYLWVEITDGANVISDITPYFKGDASYLQWPHGDKRHIFSIQNESLVRIDAGSGAEYPEYVKDVAGYGLFGDEVYVLKKDHTLERMNLDEGSFSVILDDPQVADMVFKDKGTYRVEVISEDTIFFISSGGTLSANKLPYRFADKGVIGIQPDDEKKRVLFWTEKKIGMLDLFAEKTGQVEFEKGAALTWIYTGGKRIKQVFWAYDDSHILLRDDRKVFLVSLNPEGDHDVNGVLKLRNDLDVYYSEDTGQLYFLPFAGSSLFETQIVSETSIIQLPGQKQKKKKEADNGV